MVASTRLASFNVENMFDRPKAMSRDGASQAPEVLAAHARVNQLIAREVYDDATKVEILIEPVEVHQLLGDGPGQGGLAVRVAGDQPGLEPGAGLRAQPRAVAAQQAADAVERVAIAAAVAQGVLLDAPAHVVHGGQAQAHDMERVEHPHRIRKLAAQRGRVAAERVQRRRSDRRPPVGVALAQPVVQHAA